MRHILVLTTTLLLAACSSSKSATEPTSVAPGTVPTPPGAGVHISGRVVATIAGEPLTAVALDFGGAQTTTDAAGTFNFGWTDQTNPRSVRLALSGPAILPRSLTLDTSVSRNVALDAIALSSGFDLDYYRRFVRNTSDAPGTLRPIQRWTQAPRVWVKSVDEAGQPIDESTLARTTSALMDDAAAWTGGRFGLVEVVRGPEGRIGRSGWITVRWPNPASDGNNCGRAQVGVDGGWIELNYLNPRCACGDTRVGAGVVRHELGHALGLFHTNEPGDLMRSTLDVQTLCNGKATARERFHAAIAYSRPVGNTDPDNDPIASVQRRHLEPIVIVD